jgi:hypothetical protein
MDGQLVRATSTAGLPPPIPMPTPLLTLSSLQEPSALLPSSLLCTPLLVRKKRGRPSRLQQQQQELEKVLTKDVEVNDFHVVQVIADTRLNTAIYYVGHIISKEPKGYSIQCLRRYNTYASSTNQFINPTEDDICLYQNEDIVQLLSHPKIVRGVHQFLSEELHPFIKNLRLCAA